MNLEEFQKEVYSVAVEHGWHETDREVGEVIALMHSELSEALEEWRSGRPITETYINDAKNGKPEGFFVELADAIIRILDTAESYGINMSLLLHAKNQYNKTRQYRHGGKIA